MLIQVEDDRALYYCPGCKEAHCVPLSKDRSYNGHVWSFVGALESPSLTPSINLVDRKCHHFVTNGQISYCPDSTHELSGQTVPMQHLPKEYEDE